MCTDLLSSLPQKNLNLEKMEREEEQTNKVRGGKTKKEGNNRITKKPGNGMPIPLE